ncbi:BTAD domain-containing putative transcriptional regulator [Actinomadura viridis]|uniref:BTAD domain-containing putative transcriptional regulator n=1 Tax=Actinomadura viridis TaxID=58110 RepID=UPI0036810792
MRFGVLGPVAVWADDGTPVEIRETKVRVLLAALLAREGRPAPADRLTEDLWGAAPPRRASGALQGKVSRLRRALEAAGEGGAAVVEFRDGGYLLRTPPGAVDAERFTALAVQGRVTDDLREREAVLGEALALWRGPAYDGHGDEDFARPVIRRLEESRLAVFEARARALLDLGRPGAVTAEIDELVAGHPFREGLRALQMRALYQAGRQGEALAVYQDLRERLAEELGVDPAPELAALHRSILRQDAALAAPPVPVRRARTNVPAPLTALIGRDGEPDEVRSRLRTARLVTLTGPGGVGKTRLAVETAARMAALDAAGYPDGIRLVELNGHGRERDAAVSPAPFTADDVAAVVAAALGVRDDAAALPGRAEPYPGPDASAAARLAGALRGRRTLIVMDGCEHLSGPVAELVSLILLNGPEVRVLATSRRSLGVAGEVLWPVEPLAEPAAVELFEERAAASAPGFTVGECDAGAVTTICRRLDGIPLALELAATRVRGLGVRELAARLDDRFAVLATGHRDAPPQQRTLRAVIDWSWDLLTGRERAVLRRLAVHAGGFTLAAAERVCAGAGVAEGEVAHLMVRLVDHSLVTRAADGRYHLLESVAAYCAERLEEAGETERSRRRHLAHHLEFCERAEAGLRGPGQQEWLRRLDAETANVRAALAWAVRPGAGVDAGADAVRLACALGWYWFLRGRHTEAVRSLRVALDAPGADAGPAVRLDAEVWWTGFRLLTGRHGDGEDDAGGKPGEHGRDHGEEVGRIRDLLVRHGRIAAPLAHAHATWFLGFALYRSGEDLFAAWRLVSEAFAVFRPHGDQWGQAAALGSLAGLALLRGDLPAVERDGGAGLALFRALGDAWGQSQIAYSLAALAEVAGDYPTAARLHRDGLRLAEYLELWHEAADRLVGLGRIALLEGDHARAEEMNERAARLAARHDYPAGEVHAVLGLALGARRKGDDDLAERHLRDVLEWHRSRAFEPGPALVLAELGFLAERRGDAGAAFDAHEEGLAAALAGGDPRAVALALEGLAGAHALAGRPEKAAALLGAAAAARDSVGAPLPPAERGDVDRITGTVRAALGEAGFAARFTAGGDAGPEHMSAHALSRSEL